MHANALHRATETPPAGASEIRQRAQPICVHPRASAFICAKPSFDSHPSGGDSPTQGLHRPLGRLAVLATLAAWAIAASPAHAGDLSVCERAAAEAEQSQNLPAGLLTAIGRVESGRWDQQLRRVVPWPWAVDVAGNGVLLDSKDAAVATVQAQRAGGQRNIDVGCFQINLLHHPDAFASAEQALDPRVNAQYAARFLTGLRARLGSWEQAVAAYHSATPELGEPYRKLVFASWSGAGETQRQAVVARDVVAIGSAYGGIRVWTPSAPGTAPRLIAMTASERPAVAADEVKNRDNAYSLQQN
jgi:hypothetical protein